MSTARFRVYGKLDGALGGTVSINRETGLVTVRPHRRRRAYQLPLEWVARALLEHVVKVETAEVRAAAKQRGRRR